MPLIIRPTFDASSAEADFNKMMAGLASKANLPVKPQVSLPTGDSFKPLSQSAEKVTSDFQKARREAALFLDQLNFDAGKVSLSTLTAKVAQSEQEFQRARKEAEEFAASISSIDTTQGDPAWIQAYAAQLSKLTQASKQAQQDLLTTQERLNKLKFDATDAERASAQIDKLKANLASLFDRANLEAGKVPLDELKQRAEKAQVEFEKAKTEVQQFGKDIAGIDLKNVDPARAQMLSEEFSRLGGKASDAFNEASAATKNYEQALKRIEAETERNQMATITMAARIERVRAVYNDARDIFDITTVSLLGFTESEKQAASETAYLAEKAIMVGLGIGGWPGLLTGVALGFTGVAHWITEKNKRLNELTKSLRTAQQDYQALTTASQKFGAQAFDFSAAQQAIAAQIKVIDELKMLSERAKTSQERAVAVANIFGQMSEDFSDAGTRVDQVQKETAETQKYKIAQDQLNDSIKVFYDQAISRSKEYGEEMFESTNNLYQYLGKNRPIEVIQADLDKASDKFGKMGEEVRKSEQKLKEINFAFSKEASLVDALTIAFKYNITSQEQMKQITEENIQAHNLWSTAFRKIESLMREEQQTKEEQKAKYKEALEARKKFNEEMNELTSFQKEEFGYGDDSILDTKGMREEYLTATQDFESFLSGLQAKGEEALPQLLDALSVSGKSSLEELIGGLDSPENISDSVIGEMGRESVKSAAKMREMGLVWDELRQEFVDAPSIPLFEGELTSELLRDIDPLRAAIQDLFGIWTTEGSRAEAQMIAFTNRVSEIGNAAASAIGGAASSAFGELFDAMAANEEQLESFGKGFLRKTAAALRSTGSELIGDGIANELKAAAMFFIPGLQGNAAGLAAMGAAEIAAGVAMGGVGVGLGRKAGPAPEKEKEMGAGGSVGPSRSNGDSFKNQTPIVVNLSGVPFGVLSEREMTAIGERVYQSSEAFKSNGGMTFPS